MLLNNSSEHGVRTDVRVIANCLHPSFNCICRVSQCPGQAASDSPTYELSKSNLVLTHSVILVLLAINVRDSKSPLVVFKKCKIYSEARSVSNQHALVPPAKSFESFKLVNPQNFCFIRHFSMVLLLCSNL